MASKKVEFHEDAALEYEAALEWYLERSILAASKFAAALNRAMDMIAEAPQRWPTGSKGTRRFFHLQLFIASFQRSSKCWQSPTPDENPVIGNNAFEAVAILS